MEQLRVRHIKTVESNNDYYALFETGKLNTPIYLMTELEARELLLQLQEALKD